MQRWCGKTAVVTGASGGIGGGIALALAEAGLRVVNLDVKPQESGTKVCGAGSIETRHCDLTVLKELASAFSWVEEAYGGTDVIVNCAGFCKPGTITSVGNPISDEDISITMDLNIRAMIFCTRHAVDSMKKRGFDGHVINISSIAGHYVPFTAESNVYASSKYAATSFTACLANELATFGSKIKVTCVSPGLVRTPMTAALRSSFDGVPYLEPRDIADAVLYVLSTPPHVNITEIAVQPVAEMRI